MTVGHATADVKLLQAESPTHLSDVVAVPSGQHALLARVEHHAFDALHVQVAEEALVPAAEAEESHGRGDADVNAEHARLDVADELARARSAGGEDAGAV